MANNRPVLIDIGQGLSIMVGLPTIPIWKTQERPQNASPGTFGYNLQTKSLEYWDGSSWYAAALAENA